MKRSAFTLIELLMVVLIIALLLTLLVPGISAALRLANRARCQSNLKNIGNALHDYFSVYQRNPRRTASVTNPYTWDDSWCDWLLTKYLPNPKLLFCPDSNSGWGPQQENWSKSWTNRKTSYAILDGMPNPAGGSDDTVDPRSQQLGTEDGANSWNIPPDSDGFMQGFCGIMKDGTYRIIRPIWQDKNVPVMGDLVLEYPGSAWIVNHGSRDSDDPLGMNILFADSHAAWVTAEAPKETVEDKNKQRLWRRIWKGSGGEYVRWLVDPDEIAIGN